MSFVKKADSSGIRNPSKESRTPTACLFCADLVFLSKSKTTTEEHARRYELLSNLCKHVKVDVSELPSHCTRSMFPFCSYCESMVVEIWDQQLLIEQAESKIRIAVETIRDILVVIELMGENKNESCTSPKNERQKFTKLNSLILEAFRNQKSHDDMDDKVRFVQTQPCKGSQRRSEVTTVTPLTRIMSTTTDPLKTSNRISSVSPKRTKPVCSSSPEFSNLDGITSRFIMHDTTPNSTVSSASPGSDCNKRTYSFASEETSTCSDSVAPLSSAQPGFDVSVMSSAYSSHPETNISIIPSDMTTVVDVTPEATQNATVFCCSTNSQRSTSTLRNTSPLHEQQEGNPTKISKPTEDEDDNGIWSMNPLVIARYNDEECRVVYSNIDAYLLNEIPHTNSSSIPSLESEQGSGNSFRIERPNQTENGPCHETLIFNPDDAVYDFDWPPDGPPLVSDSRDEKTAPFDDLVYDGSLVISTPYTEIETVWRQKEKGNYDMSKQFMCDVCGSCFNKNGNLVRHMQNGHGRKRKLCKTRRSKQNTSSSDSDSN